MAEVSWFENAGVSLPEFMANRWRKQPVVFEKGLESVLANLATELIYKEIIDLTESDLVESRMIGQGSDHLDLTFGPFSPKTLSTTLSNSKNMLMVQGADQHIQSLSDLLTHQFGFMPRWRVEDIMVTLGGTGASCGPHFDHYDVFLFQLRGEKHWHWDTKCHKDEELDLEAEVRLLPTFAPEYSQTMEPGDVLYLPPGAGHWGIAGADSMSLSIGIRNPTLMELVSSYTDELLDNHVDVSGETKTLDDLLDPTRPSMSRSMIDGLQSRYLEFVSDPVLMAKWFGCYMTELKEPELIQPKEPEEMEIEMSAHRRDGVPFRLTLPSRITHQAELPPFQCFLNGEVLELDDGCLEMINCLARDREVAAELVFERQERIALMKAMILNGAIQNMEPIQG